MDGPSVFHSAHKSLVGGSNERETTGERREREREKAEKEVFQLDARSCRNSCVSFTTALDNGPRSPLSFLDLGKQVFVHTFASPKIVFRKIMVEIRLLRR